MTPRRPVPLSTLVSDVTAERRRETTVGLALCLCAAAMGAWALWPALFPVVSPPSVTHQVLSEVTGPTALLGAEYATTASITPLISGKLNLNSATEAQLEALPGVGPALAARLLKGRPYRSLADVDAVRGIGPSLLQRLAPLVTF